MLLLRPSPTAGRRPDPPPPTLARWAGSIIAAVAGASLALCAATFAAEPAPFPPPVLQKKAAKPKPPPDTPAGVYALAAAPQPRGKIDGLVFARLAQFGIAPAHGCTDAVFVRRVFLEVIGTLPTALETKEFLASPAPDKRAALIDRLPGRDEYADDRAMKCSDLLRVKAEFPVNLWPNAAQAYHHWIVTSLRANWRYDQFARELLTPNGSNFRIGPVNFYHAVPNKEPASIARTVALTFLGERAEKWAPARLAGLAGFFTHLTSKGTGEWKEEIVFFDPNQPQPDRGAAPAPFPDGTVASSPPDRDGRDVFTTWLVDARNPWFAPVMANRVWSWLLARGIVHEPDDYKGLLPPSVVLTELQGRFSEAGFLGGLYKPFATDGDPGAARFVLEGVVARGITDERQRAHREFLHPRNTFERAMPGGDPRLDALGQCGHDAYAMILGDAGKVFDFSQENDALRDGSGRNPFGQSCRRARRLVERGVPYITINDKSWDTHKQHFPIMRPKLPEFDPGLATLLADLAERGLLESTIVFAGGEFGRTPKLLWESPWNGGRGHGGKAFSAVVAGGGFKGGHVVGQTDARGEEVTSRPVQPGDLIASLYELLGIDANAKLPHPKGADVRAMPAGTDVGRRYARIAEIM